MDIEKAKKELKTRTEHFRQLLNSQIWVETDVEAVNVVLNELDNKDKIINEMTEMLVKDHEWFYSEFDNYTKQDFIDYFTKKVTKED